MKPGSVLLTFAVCLPFYASPQAVTPKGRTVLETFASGDVRLLDSRWKTQQLETKAYYLGIPNDDLLKGFRERMHKPTYGAADLGGWYTQDIWMPFGQIISGLSRMYAATGDEACRQKVNSLIECWGECIDSTGYFYYTKNNKSPHYTYEKMVCGLLDAYTYAGNKDALRYLGVITDWAVKNLSRDKTWAGEWYTLPENLYKAYLVTGDQKYNRFAQEWEYTEFWQKIRSGQVFDETHKAYHAYSHLNTFSSASMAYLVTGDTVYRQTIKAAYRFFRDRECFPTGGFGPNEMLTPQADIRNALYGTDRSFETQCGSWAVFKLCKYLETITGDGQYGDWTEQMLVNGIGASIPMSADGRVMYYSDDNPREGLKKNTEDPWTCCTGTRLQAIADYNQQIYYHAPGSLYVSQFVPSAVRWDDMTITQKSNFPTDGNVQFIVNTPVARSFRLHFRQPGWLKGPAKFLVNGKPMAAAVADHWYSIRRTWHDHDVVQLILPMAFSFQRVVTDYDYPRMLLHGPVVLAARCADDRYPAALLRETAPWSRFTPVDGEPGSWHFTGAPGMLIRPFYDFKAQEPYVIALDSAVQHQIGSHNMTLSGDWHLFYKFASDTGATITARFNGTGFRFTGNSNPDGGKFAVILDGRRMQDGDEYAATPAPFSYQLTGLGTGRHTVIIKMLAGKNKAAKTAIVNYSTLEETD